MNIKIFILLSIILIVGCKKNNNSKLAENYYNIALSSVERDDQKQYKQAIENLDKAIKYKPLPNYYAVKATLLFKIAHYEESEVFFKKALKGKLNPRLRADIQNNYACLLSQLDKIHQANSIWEELVNDQYYLTPEVALFNQANLLVRKKYYKAACGKLQSAINLSSDYIDARYYLAYISYKYLENRGLASEQARAILEINPDHMGAKQILQR